MISKLIIAVLKVITKIVGILFYPIDAILVTLIPDLSTYITNITYFMSLPFQYINWILVLLNIPPEVPLLIIGYWIGKYAIATAMGGAKLVITLYQRFKP